MGQVVVTCLRQLNLCAPPPPPPPQQLKLCQAATTQTTAAHLDAGLPQVLGTMSQLGHGCMRHERRLSKVSMPAAVANISLCQYDFTTLLACLPSGDLKPPRFVQGTAAFGQAHAQERSVTGTVHSSPLLTVQALATHAGLTTAGCWRMRT